MFNEDYAEQINEILFDLGMSEMGIVSSNDETSEAVVIIKDDTFSGTRYYADVVIDVLTEMQKEVQFADFPKASVSEVWEALGKAKI